MSETSTKELDNMEQVSEDAATGSTAIKKVLPQEKKSILLGEIILISVVLILNQKRVLRVLRTLVHLLLVQLPKKETSLLRRSLQMQALVM